MKQHAHRRLTTCLVALLGCSMLVACTSTGTSTAAPPAAQTSEPAAQATPATLPVSASMQPAAQMELGHCPTPNELPANDMAAEAPTAPPVSQPAPKDADITYDTKTNTILVRDGDNTTVPVLAETLNRPDLLREVAPGEWLLTARLQVEKDAGLVIAGPDVAWLKLRSNDDDFVSIKVLGGTLRVERTCVTSWDDTQGRYDENHSNGRSFVLARDKARMDIEDAELSYLGYDAHESYGLAWRTEGTSGEIVNSRLAYNFYGLYSYEASDLVIRGNDVHHSVLYGIDPHTRSNRLVIEGNRAHHNGKHGIILAEECSNSIIRNNIVYNNALHGIVLYQGSDNNVVENNTTYGNGLQGININDASNNIVRNNTTYDNEEAGIGVGQKAKDNEIIANIVRDNRADGITLYSDAEQNIFTQNQITGNARYGIYVNSDDNVIDEGNRITGNLTGVYIDTNDAPNISVERNEIANNHEGDVRNASE